MRLEGGVEWQREEGGMEKGCESGLGVKGKIKDEWVGRGWKGIGREYEIGRE